MKQYIVNSSDVGKRIDAYVSSINNEISRTAVQRLIEEENILVNKKPTKASYKVQENDLIEINENKRKDIELNMKTMT